MNLSLERVLRFVCVAEQLSFTRAAALLRVDQPWLSRQIMQLEERLGFALFDRSGPRIALTLGGSEFLASAQEVTRAVQSLQHKAEEMKRRSLAVLRIGVSYPTYSVQGREILLSRYASARPNVSLDYSAFEWSDDVMERVSAGDLDFGIVLGPVTDPNLETCIVDVIDPRIGIPKEDPLADLPSITLSDLKGRRIAVGVKDRASRRYAEAYSWIDEVGAVPVFVIEGRRYIFDVVEKQRLIVLCYSPADKLPESFVRRKIDGHHPLYDLCLVRANRVISSSGEQLWRLGKEMESERLAARKDQISRMKK